MTNEQFAALVRFATGYDRRLLTAENLAAAFGVTPRHVRRILRSPIRTPRCAWNRLGETVRTAVLALKREHPEYNCQWISEIVSDRHERRVSRSSVWRILRDADLLGEQAPDRTPRTRFSAERTQ
jgi:hypothetical protein